MTIFNASAPWFGQLTREGMLERLSGMFGDRAGDIVAAYEAEYPDYTPLPL
ncbi:MAG: hypothetical protein U5O39_04160 [Gammaproteobacteria bacterium]|nr:hypothetical protein [Gammaproteobacteria bacterium]